MNTHPPPYLSPLDTITCPCLSSSDFDDPLLVQQLQPHRLLQSSNNQLWKIIYSSIVLVIMFAALISDKIGADMIMLGTLTLFMAAGIVTVDEGVAGFSNEGVLTVISLFVVAAGIGHTGALDWYMSKLLGKPKTVAVAQLRLMIPIAIVSAFMNNTPVVAIMIPIIQSWSKRIGMNVRLLLIPLSFSTILGGTCTLIGTSTNLVVVGLMKKMYGAENVNIGLFDLGEYGVPVLFAGLAYIVGATGCLLDRKSDGSGEAVPFEGGDDILLGARLTKWSPAAGRSVGRSGLRDTRGSFLVSVHRAATGNVHRAVGQDFVLSVGDVLYFTGLVEGFGEFCQEHGLEMVTSDVQDEISITSDGESEDEEKEKGGEKNPVSDVTNKAVKAAFSESVVEEVVEPGTQERLRIINHMSDAIRGFSSSALDPPSTKRHVQFALSTKAPAALPAKIVVTTFSDDDDEEELVLIGIDAPDRPGLLLDISKSLLQLELTLRQTEASVIDHRSISVWRCVILKHNEENHDIEKQIYGALHALLDTEIGVQTQKEKGLRVIRAIVTDGSHLIGGTVGSVSFKERFGASIVAVQKKGRNPNEAMSRVVFDKGDVLVLQAKDNSPLLTRPPEDFYTKMSAGMKKRGSKGGLVNLVRRTFSSDKMQRFSSENTQQLAMTEAVDDNVIVVPQSPTTVATATSNSSSSIVQTANSEDSEDGYFVGDPEMGRNVADSIIFKNIRQEQNRSNDVTTSPPTDHTPTLQQENVWRDLRVLFSSATSSAESREFLTAMQIAPKSPLINKTAIQSGINKLPGVFLVSIERPPPPPSTRSSSKSPISASATPHHNTSSIIVRDFDSFRDLDPIMQRSTAIDMHDDPLLVNDVLWFSGSANVVSDLRKIPGLLLYQSSELAKIEHKVYDRRLVQAVVARQGVLVGKTVKDLRFRTKYGAAVIAIHREGKRVHAHPNQVKLQGGDVLLLEAGPNFVKDHAESDKDFVLISEVKDSAPPRLSHFIPAIIITVAMLAIYTANLLSLLVSSLLANMLMLCIGILSQQEARDAMNWEVYVAVGSAFGIGTALTNSGIAGGIADGLVQMVTVLGLGHAGLYAAIYFATFLISSVVTNNAAAALVFPIAMGAVEQTGADPRLMAYCVMLSASASFMSPFGYTTNLMIYGPGGYKYNDFLFFGGPMQIVLWILTVVLLGVKSSMWYLSWIVCFGGLVVVAGFSIVTEGKKSK